MGRIFGLDLQTLLDAIFMMINLFILFWAMSYNLYVPVKTYMEKRTEKIKNDLDVASQEKKEAIALKRDYEEKLKDIKKEADLILSQARKTALAREEEIIQEAKTEANRLLERASVEIEREKEKAKDDVKHEMVTMATLLAEKFVALSMNEEKQEQIVQQTLNEMGDSTWLN